MSDARPLVSFLVPTYNGEETIRETLASLQSQTYPTTEIIVIDDGSDDATREIVTSEFKDVTLVSLHENRGHSFAMNLGLENATGEYVGLMDDDIEIQPEWTTGLVERFQDLPADVAIVHPTIKEGDVTSPTEAGSIQSLKTCGVLGKRDVIEEVGALMTSTLRGSTTSNSRTG